MENIDDGKDKKHSGKLTNNSEDRTPIYYMSEVTCRKAAAVLNKRYI